MEIKYNATGARRKELVKAIAAILGAKPVYLGTPSFAYQVGDIEVTRDGALRLPDGMAAQPLAEALAKAGFHYEGEDAMNMAEEAGGEADANEAATEETPQDVAAGAPALEDVERPAAEDEGTAVEPPAVAQDGGIGLTVELPAAQVNVELVEKLLEAKGGLIRKALGVTELPVETHEDKVAFPWFAKQPPEDERKATIAFLAHLAAFSKHAKRVTAKAKPVANEKYAFRCFLLRLGFIGKEWKDERKTLLKNLSGSSAFRDGQPHEREQGSEAEQAQEVTA
ncbi:virulence protein [uncultured Selenomonas sp.]|uniref:virulence protein n=1 Tax=uncultured Selenomonas sp. TaxID=159275 RepID=UPI0025EEC0EA|nr:virulence protein [uncultured Selenomonas sp.]